MSSECSSFSDSDSYQSSTEADEVEDKNENVLHESEEENLIGENFFKNKLRQWALKFHITLIALSAFLLLLQSFVAFQLPLDGRTVIGTMRNVHISKMNSGEYYHFRLKRAVQSILRSYKKMGKNLDEIKLAVNIDGLPIFKASKESL